MSGTYSLKDAFQLAAYPLGGHGKRNIQVLMDAFGQLDGSLASDMYGAGEWIEAFQTKIANLLGKEEAVFMPSGTMAQQIALRIWCDRNHLSKVAYHPLCHMEIHEQDGLRQLHHLEPVLLADNSRTVLLDDVLNLQEDVSCLLLELPQREIGGQLPPYEELAAISSYCREKGIRLHMDGARLFEILPYYQKTAGEISSLFDSVYVSFYKGIGGLAGAVLAGSVDFIQEAKIWKRRHGGDLISLYPYIVSADYYLERRLPKMEQYYLEAKELAGLFNQCHNVATVPREPVSNMFHVHIGMAKADLEPLLAFVSQATGVGFTSYLRETGEGSCAFELSIGDSYALVPKNVLNDAFGLLDKRLRE